MTWSITYYSKRVFDSVKKMPKRIKARYMVLTERMEERGPDLGMPHTRAMGGGLFEIRVKAHDARHGERSEGVYSGAGSDFLPSVSDCKKSLRGVESVESPCVVEP